MNFAIVASKKDPAGMNIIKELQKMKCKTPIYLLEDETVYSDNIDKKINADFIIFASKHQSIKKVKTLTVHAIGNWKKADFGGRDNIICNTSALVLKHFFQELNKQAQNSKLDNYLVSLESTHHGPYIETPCLFIEVGSSIEEWNDLNACRIVAETILESINNFKHINKEKLKIAIGIGGPHYCPNFNKIQLGNKFALGYIVAEYALPLTEQMIKEAISKTKEKVDCFIIDWKGLRNSEQRKNILNVLEKFNIKILRTSEAKLNSF